MCRNFQFFSRFELFSAGKSIVERLRTAGYQAYFAGGAVRDLLLGRQPGDIDIATSATPEQIHTIFPETHDSGVSFGVITIHEEKFQFETATFRKECGYTDGRHPGKTSYTESPEEDVQRRDFTINGMMLDPVSGEILDFVGGMEDLKRGIIRTIGDGKQRFQEDALRILRAIRFHARYDFPLAPETREAAENLAGNLVLLSPERIKAELEEMLTGPRPEQAFRLMEELGILKVILPEISALKGVEQPPEYHPEGDVFEHTMIMLGMMAHPTPSAAWGILLHDVGKKDTFKIHPDGRIHFYGHEAVGAGMARRILQRFRASRELTELVSAGVRDHMRFTQSHLMRRSTLRKLLAEPSFKTTLEILRTDCASCHGKMDDYLFLLDFMTELHGEPAIPPPLITGNDLIALGYRPGPAMGKLLQKIQTLQLEGTLSSREEALDFLDHSTRCQRGN